MPSPMLKTFGREMVHFKIGPDEVDFGMHKAAILQFAYFKAAFTSGFEEAKTGIMKFPDIDVEVFQLFSDWIYTQELWSKGEKTEELKKRLHQLIRLYVFADMVQLDTLKTDLIDTMDRLSGHVSSVPSASFAYAWENTMPDCPLRALIISWCVWEYKIADSVCEELPKDMLVAIMREAIETVNNFRESVCNEGEIMKEDVCAHMPQMKEKSSIPRPSFFAEFEMM